ncbi:MAG: hypothetical protein RLY16_1686 [Bacteroidota bacterium]
MKKWIFILLLVTCFGKSFAQQKATFDTTQNGNITVIGDTRLAELVKKEAAFNDILASAPRNTKGYRLLILSTNDRPLAMQVRSQLLQKFPDQKVYMSFQPPYIKLKFGNFIEKADAERYKKDIDKYKLVANNIYVVAETVELKPEKNKDKEAAVAQ